MAWQVDASGSYSRVGTGQSRRPGGGHARAWWENRGVMVYYHHPWLFVQYVNRWGKKASCERVQVPEGTGSLELRKLASREADRMLVRKLARGTTPGMVDEVKPCALATRYPNFFDFLAADWWSDTEARVTGKCHAWKEEGILKLCLADRDAARVLFLSGRTLTELLEVAEAALADPGADWRPDRRLMAERAAKVTKGVDKRPKR
jgi:hypothetical protein